MTSLNVIGGSPEVNELILLVMQPFIDIKVNTMAVDALAPCVARPSAAMVLNKQDKHVLVFHEKGFKQHAA